jgi:uncharacterized protein (DUF305 family)
MKKRNWIVMGWLVLTVIVLTACGTTPGQTTTNNQMPGMVTQTPGENLPATGAAFDEMFINMMVPHHEGAVEMAKIALERAEHPEIREMANAIVSSQQDEISQMRDWKQQWYGSSGTPSMSEMPSLSEMPGMGGSGHPMDMQADVDKLKDAQDPFDLAFIDAMIPHHQSAIDAAALALNQATQPEIKAMAQEIIEAQQKEIDQMNAWRSAWYPDAPPAGTSNH